MWALRNQPGPPMQTIARKRLPNLPALRWLVFYGLILAAWLGLFVQLRGGQFGAQHGGQHGAQFGEMLQSLNAAQAGYGAALAMWALMGAAMMAPTFLPALKTYDDLRHTGAVPRGGFYALLGGFLAVWLGFAARRAGQCRFCWGWRGFTSSVRPRRAALQNAARR